MLLRRAEDAELPEVVGLVNTAFRGSVGWAQEFHVMEGPRITLEDLQRDLSEKPTALQLVARDAEGTLQGSVWMEPMNEDVWYLGLLAVRPDAQEKKLGRQLLAEAEKVARQNGAQRIRISVMNIRESLTAWYERRGYARTGEIKPFPYGDLSVGRPLRDDLAFVMLEKAL